MKVKELIEELSKLNQDAMVVVSGHEGGVNELWDVSSRVIHVNANANSPRWIGRHEIDYDILADVVLPETHAIAVHLY